MLKKKNMLIVKVSILLIIMFLSFYTFRYTDLKTYMSVEKIDVFVRYYHNIAPAIFIVIFAMGVCLFVPSTIFIAAGAALFGHVNGFIFNELGAVLGASGAFFVGRYLGRDFATSIIGDKLKEYDDKIAKNGFATVFSIRILCIPFTPMSFALGLTKVRFKDYFLGTALGFAIIGFAFTFGFATITDIMKSKDWSQLFSYKTLLSILLIAFSIFIPSFITRNKDEWKK